jgi:DNA topoisomerase IB
LIFADHSLPLLPTKCRVAKIIRACQDLPGQELLQYHDEGAARLRT